MMTQLITSASDLAAAPPSETPATSDSPDNSSDGFATLLSAICLAPVPVTLPTELTEAATAGEGAPTVSVAAIETAPLSLLPGDSIINLNPTGLNPTGLNSTGLTADNTASLLVPADAATADTDPRLHNLVNPDAAAMAIQ